MEISYLGGTSYKIKSKLGVVVMNPDERSDGKSKLTADIVTVTEQGKGAEKVGGTSRRKEPFVIGEPGEYEVENISIFGYGSGGKNTIYALQSEDLRVVHLGQLSEPLDKEMIEALDGVDVLMVPVGEGVINEKQIVELVNSIEPAYIVPMSESGESKNLVEALSKGIKETKILIINKATLPLDTSEVVIFE